MGIFNVHICNTLVVSYFTLPIMISGVSTKPDPTRSSAIRQSTGDEETLSGDCKQRDINEKTLPAKNVIVHMVLLFIEILNHMITDAIIDNLMPDRTLKTYYDYVNDFQSCHITGEDRIQKSKQFVCWVTMNRHLLKRPDVKNTWEEFISDGSPLHESLCYILPKIHRSGKQIMTFIAQYVDSSYLATQEDVDE